MAGSSMGLETQLLSQFTCNICKSQLREPRALPCLHSFCIECLKGMCGDELFVHTLTCPTCDQAVTVPGGNVSNFPVDFLADRFLSVVMEICPDAASSSQTNTDQEKAKNYEMCYGHDKIRDMYCHSCNQVYCTDCSPDHVDHAVGTVKDAAMSAVQNMTSLTNAARDRINPLQEAIEEIRQSIEETEATHAAAKEGLDRSFEEMLRALKHRKKDLLEELNDLRYDRVSVLKMKRNELCATIKRSLELSQTVTEVLEGDTDTNLLYKEEELCDALYRLCNKSYLIVTKDEDVKVDYIYKPKMLTKALEAITNVGEIEFHIEEDSDEEDEEEDEVLYDEEEMAREEIIANEEIERAEIAQEPREEEVEIAKKDVPTQDTAKEEVPSVSAQGERNKQKQPKQEDHKPKEEDQKPKEEDQKPKEEDQKPKKDKQPVRRDGNQDNKDDRENKRNDAPQQYRERETEVQIEEEEKDTITLDTPRTSTTTSLPQTSTTSLPRARQDRSARRSGTTRDSNPCFEVKFTAPDNATISRYKDISRTPILEWGGKGHETGELYYPYGVAITQQNNLLVSDQGNSRIQVLDTSRGSSVMCFGGDGTNTGQFNGPSGVTTHEGQFYVSDTGNDRVQVFDQNGIFVRCIGENKLHSPRGITVSGDYIYIANSGMGNISVFDSRTGELVDKIHNKSPHSCDLQLPTGVTRDSNGYIFFTDANNFFCNHFVQVLTREHRYSHSIGVVGNKPGEFLGPSDLTIDSLGNVIITDTRNHRIQIVDKNNSLVACFGGFGRKKGLLHFPYGVCERDGVLFVSDTNNHRIQVFNSRAS